MARDFKRTDRVGDQIQKELATLIQFELKDPRLGMVTLNAVRVSSDFGYADVYFTALGQLDEDEAEQQRQAEKILAGAAGFLRGELARRIRLRVMPHLRFHYDHSMERGQNLSRLIDTARRDDARYQSTPSSEDPARGDDSKED
ncbi:30S ribosome-binding factor RbfA [Natronospirillum operosum]|uniref:Ribosome-binding factor A n=1 Tax=Natronospirillum operosum TaxID=2759953 RepID=A0A4Z0WAB3_9GAMM|nr:30S ribosome-binding factor RbfA [Natronospirillum operosum]TGG94119.1 30S ribosome-binding factor RbfA [Natronospirillum operosum]